MFVCLFVFISILSRPFVFFNLALHLLFTFRARTKLFKLAIISLNNFKNPNIFPSKIVACMTRIFGFFHVVTFLKFSDPVSNMHFFVISVEISENMYIDTDYNFMHGPFWE